MAGPVATAPGSVTALLAKAAPVFSRQDERLDHVSLGKVTVKAVELSQPEVIALKVCVRRIVRVPSQIAKELHQDKRAIELLLGQGGVLCDAAQGSDPRQPIGAVRSGAEF